MKQKIIIVLTSVLLISSCTSLKNANNLSLETKEAIRDSLNEARKIETKAVVAKPPKAVTDALLSNHKPSLRQQLAAKSNQERFDITVNRMPAKPFFMSLVNDTPINMVVHPDVKGAISLNLKSVLLEDVLSVARDVYGYEYQKNNAGYMIMPARLQSRIFQVSYLNIERKGESNTRVTSGQLSGTGARRSTQENSVNDSGGNNSSQAFASSRIATESKSDFWSSLDTTINTIIGDGDGRSVVVNAQSGLVVVRAMPGELRDVGNFLRSAQLNLHRQVIIEAKIIEVQLNNLHQAGVNWAKLNQDAGDIEFANQLEVFDGQSELLSDAGEFLVGGLTGTQSLPGFGGLFAIGAATDDFAAIIRLLNQQGDVNVLSSPRVSTVNNQKAVIKVGSDEFFVTEVSATTTTGTSTTTTPQIVLTPFFSGIALDVTPQINAKREVILHIHPTISEVVDQVKDITIAGQDQSLPLAFSTVRESDSIVRAKNGQVIVIGGLMQNQSSDSAGGLPGLSKIPILGNLFKQSKKTHKRSELVILLKPHVIGNDDAAWQHELTNISDRVDHFTRE